MSGFKRLVHIFISCAAFCIGRAPCSAEQDASPEPLPTIDALRERWKSECEGLDAFHMIVDYVFVNPRNKAADTVTECIRQGDKRLKTVNGMLAVYNPEDRIAFQLQKSSKSEEGDATWILADVERTPADASMYSTPDADRGYGADIASYAYGVTTMRYESSLYCLENAPLHRLLSPDRVVSVEISRGSDGAIDLEATFVPDGVKAPRGNADFISGHIRRLSAKLDPQHYCLRAAAAEFDSQIGLYRSFQVTLDYDFDSQGRPRPQLVRFDGEQNSHPGMRYTYELQYRLYEIDPSIDQGVFTLEHYGIESPVAAKAPGSYRTPPWLYYFFGGVCTEAIGAYFIYRATRSSVTA